MAAAATIGAEPIPDSLENRPRAMPYRMVVMMAIPAVPPIPAFKEKASLHIQHIDFAMKLEFPQRIMIQPIIYSKAINGMRPVQMRVMLFIPPKMTNPVRMEIIAPMPNLNSSGLSDDGAKSMMLSQMALACTALPMPKAAPAVNMLKRTASHFMPSPRSSAYIGPPAISLFSVRIRYFTARCPSPYFVAMPKIPTSQHQKTAPGPPKAMAVATPIILPVPIVAANDVARAPKLLTSPSLPLSDLTLSLIAVKIFL